MRAIIIGATSGIGRGLAKEMSACGYTVGVTGRRTKLLDSLQEELPNKCHKSTMDLNDVAESVAKFSDLVEQMDGVDIVVINSGTGSTNPDFPLSDELNTIAVNVTGFTAMANAAYRYFEEKNSGQIVAISSIAAVRGGPAVSYNASKAYVSSYMEGLCCRVTASKKNIHITDIRPGFVDTAMAKGDGVFWSAPVDKAAKQIFRAIQQKRRVAYITKRWRLIALLISWLPFSLYRRVVA